MSRILLISASPRAADNCPGENGKSYKIAQHLLSNPPQGVEYDFLDLAIRTKNGSAACIQQCKGCYSTASSLCAWPCNCYKPDSDTHPDFMHDQRVYSRLEKAHGILFVSPVHWYGAPSHLDTMFSRLVCASAGNPDPEGTVGGKDKEKAVTYALTPEWVKARKDFLGGRCAAWFVFGDGGANDLDPEGRPRWHQHRDVYNPSEESQAYPTVKSHFQRYVWTLRYMGISVQDSHIVESSIGRGYPYAVANSILKKNPTLYENATQLAIDFSQYVGKYTEDLEISVSSIHPAYGG